MDIHVLGNAEKDVFVRITALRHRQHVLLAIGQNGYETRTPTLAIVDRDEDRSLRRETRPARDERLRECGARVLVDAHDLPGRAHLRPEQRVGSREPAERQHGRLHARVRQTTVVG